MIEWSLLVGESLASGKYAAGEGGEGATDFLREARIRVWDSADNSMREGDIGAGGPGCTLAAQAFMAVTVADRRRGLSARDASACSVIGCATRFLDAGGCDRNAYGCAEGIIAVCMGDDGRYTYATDETIENIG